MSAVAKVLDAAVASFHARPVTGRYRQLMLDGVVLARRTGAGAIRRPVLVALGSGPTARRRSSTSTSPPARVLPNGKPFSPAYFAVASPVRGWR